MNTLVCVIGSLYPKQNGEWVTDRRTITPIFGINYRHRECGDSAGNDASDGRSGDAALVSGAEACGDWLYST